MTLKLHLPLPLVGQNAPSLPDGSPDPAHLTDCGEACCSIVLRAFKSLSLSPGCIRDAMGKPPASGLTTAPDLIAFLSHFPLAARPVTLTANAARHYLLTEPTNESCAIALGTWVSADFQHWVVCGQRGAAGVWQSDPWPPAHVLKTWAEFDAAFGGQLVVVSGK